MAIGFWEEKKVKVETEVWAEKKVKVTIEDWNGNGEKGKVKEWRGKGQDEIVPWQHLTQRLKLNPCASECEIVVRKMLV